jgi:aminopeptidase N
MKTIFSIFFSLYIIFTAAAQKHVRTFLEDENRVPRERVVDFTHLKLSVSFDLPKGQVIGVITHDFTVIRHEVSEIVLDAIDMEIKSVALNGVKQDYSYDNKLLTLHFTEPLKLGDQKSLEIEYTAMPRKGIYFVGWTDTTNTSRKQIWTQGQGIDNRHWMPLFDDMTDKVISEIKVTMPEKYKVLSNGKKLKEKSIKEGDKLWHYKISHPHPPYLIMLGIGEYEIEKRKSGSGVEMSLYYYPGEKHKVEPTYRHSAAMFDYFETIFGVDYPWGSYAQIPVQEFMYGAMENTTATIFGDFYLVDSTEFLDRNYVRVNAHELAHQWFGDYVTARTTTHTWLQESFATHFDMVYQGVAFGEDYFDFVRRGYNQQALDASESDLRPIAHSQAGTVRHYPKGAMVLNMLKYVVGEKQFNSTIQYYLKKHAYGTVDTEDFLIAFYENLGLPLDWFWEEWVLKGGEPHYKVDFEELSDNYRFTVQQIHEQNDLVGFFKMPIYFEVHFKDGSHISDQVMIEKNYHQVNLPIQQEKEVAFVLFDPKNQILKDVTFSKSVEFLKAQAFNAPNTIDRYEALVELRGKLSPEELFEAWNKETYAEMKAEIALHAMIGKADEQNKQLFADAIKSEITEVEKIILTNTNSISADEQPLYESLLTAKSHNVVEKALDLLCFYQPQDISTYLDQTKDRVGNRSHNVRIKWLEWSYLYSREEVFADQLIELLSPRYEFITRTNAAAALERLNYINEEGVGYIIDGLFSANSRLRGPMNGTMRHFIGQNGYQLLMRDYILTNDWTEREEAILAKFTFR